jgi:ATP-dependent protease ClpP protease subunit
MKYTINPQDNKPIMLINQEIGLNGIVGSEFQNELMYLDSLGKEEIEIHINSVGGSITDGFSIFSAIVNAKTPIKTVCVGLCASTASWLFLAGANRVIMDYGVLMVHNPYSLNGSNSTVLDIFKQSIVKMTSERTGLSEVEISNYMDAETWLDSSQCKELNFCDSIKTSAKSPKLSKTMNAYSEAYNFVNQLNKPIIKMDYSKICNRLGILEASNEDTIIKSFDAVLDAQNKLVVDAQNKVSALETEKTALANELETLKNEAKENKTIIAKQLVSNYSNKLTAETLEIWENKAIEDFAGTEILLKSLPLNKVGIDINNKKDEPKETKVKSTFELLNEIKNKNKRK